MHGVEGAQPVLSSEPRIDIGVIAAKGKGTAIVITNWVAHKIEQLNLTVQFDLTGSSVTLASGGTVKESQSAQGRRTFIFDLDVADCLIVRPSSAEEGLSLKLDDESISVRAFGAKGNDISALER